MKQSPFALAEGESRIGERKLSSGHKAATVHFPTYSTAAAGRRRALLARIKALRTDSMHILAPGPRGNSPLPFPSGPTCPASSPGWTMRRAEAGLEGLRFGWGAGPEGDTQGRSPGLGRRGARRASGGRQGSSGGEPAESQETSGSDSLRAGTRASHGGGPSNPPRLRQAGSRERVKRTNPSQRQGAWGPGGGAVFLFSASGVW